MNKMKMRGIIVLFSLFGLMFLAFIGYTVSKPKNTVQWPDYDDSTNLVEIQELDGTDQLAELIYYGEQKDFVITIEGMEETVTMTYMELDFTGWREAAKVSLYIDRERYDCSVFEGECDIVPIGSGEDPSSWMHIFPNAGKTAQEVLDEIKGNIERNGRSSVIEAGTTEVDNRTTLYLTTSDGHDTYSAVEYNGGCIVIGILDVEPEEAEGHGIRMNAMAQTVKIIE